MDTTFRFRPVAFSWVAIHPNPKGVIQFIGAAFVGTFPTVFYHYFLRKLFEEGYTVVALPFRFSFRHWPIAINLLKEQAVLRREIAEVAKRLGYEYNVYQKEPNYFWIGHSLGCKYVALLEILGDLGDDLIVAEESINKCTRESKAQIKQIEESIYQENIRELDVSTKNQPSLLIAPDISDTQSAIPRPLAFLAHFLDRIGLGALPTRKETQCLINESSLFNLTALISFNRDTIAGSENDQDVENSDVRWLIDQLKRRAFPILHQEIPGKHLEPIGIKVGRYIVDLNPFDKFIQPLARRNLEPLTVQFLEQLKQRASQVPTTPAVSTSVSLVK
jgi:hypothetical protein